MGIESPAGSIIHVILLHLKIRGVKLIPLIFLSISEIIQANALSSPKLRLEILPARGSRSFIFSNSLRKLNVKVRDLQVVGKNAIRILFESVALVNGVLRNKTLSRHSRYRWTHGPKS